MSEARRSREPARLECRKREGQGCGAHASGDATLTPAAAA